MMNWCLYTRQGDDEDGETASVPPPVKEEPKSTPEAEEDGDALFDNEDDDYIFGDDNFGEGDTDEDYDYELISVSIVE